MAIFHPDLLARAVGNGRLASNPGCRRSPDDRLTSAVRFNHPGVRVATAVAICIASPASAAGIAIAMPLCGGGTIVLHLGDDRGPPGGHGACHAGCAMRRDEDDLPGRP